MRVLETHSEEETRLVGRKLGEQARAGQVYCLDGDLGAGKTVIAKGFAEGLGIRAAVVSPTFTILQVYEGGRLPLYHFDVYRLEEEEELDEIGYEEYFYGDGVCLVEWAELFPDVMPEDAVHVRIGKDPEKGFDYRRIVVREAGDEKIPAARE